MRNSPADSLTLKISKELKKRGIFKENVCRLDEVVEKLCRLK